MADEKKKTGYQSPWEDQLKETANKILNREKFSYDLNGDALYKQYKDRYTQQGRQAMMDTMGQAQAMTGGYGNSYAQSVGQQTYQGYMQGLNDKIPSLYQIALDKYTTEGNQMRDNMNLMQQQDEIGYGRYRDQLADQNTAYSKLMALMTGYGYSPAPEELEEAGMTEAQMKAILGIEDSVGGGGYGGYDGDGDGADKEYDLDGLTGAGKNWLERNAYFHDEKVLGDPMRKFLLERQLDNSGLGRGDKELIAGKYGLKLD